MTWWWDWNRARFKLYNLLTVRLRTCPMAFPSSSILLLARWSLLAALGKTGQVRIWDWSNNELVDQSEVSAGEREFSAIDFVYGDAWLAIASNVPQLEAVGEGDLEKVAMFDLDFGGSADLAFDAVGQTLISIQPGGLARWPMDPATWLELAWARAQRNLSYRPGARPFPPKRATTALESAPIFPWMFPSPTHWLRKLRKPSTTAPRTAHQGYGPLERGGRNAVDPPLELDPLDAALHVLSDQALEDLRQPSGSFDEHALACLQRAADQLAESGQPAIDPAQALESGSTPGACGSPLRRSQPGDAASVADDLERVLEHSAQWPVDLPSALSMLSQAYYRLCQQGDAESCKRLEATTELMAYGQELNRSYKQGSRIQSISAARKGDLR